MPAFGFRTARKPARSIGGAIPARVSALKSGLGKVGLGKTLADLVANIVRGLGPAPVLQPIPVRVRDRRRHQR